MTPKLILLNGPPGSGKSTLARMYADAHPLALNLDIDRVRALLGQWRSDPRAAGLLAREIALAAARACLAEGRDVVVPQYVGVPEFVDRLERLADEAGAAFHEVVLLDSKEDALRRFAERTRLAADPAHVEAAELADAGTVAEMHDRLTALLTDRPRARVIRTRDGQVAAAYQSLVDALGD